MESTFIKGAQGKVFGRDLSQRKPEEWGWIEVNKMMTLEGENLMESMRYIQPDDNNTKDQTVLSVALSKYVLPGEKIVLDISFTAKMPKIIARAGYGMKDYFLFVHWFPQPGVYEKDKDGNWGWNCHQFFQQTEFYADFGNYDVSLTVGDHLTLGATGCLEEEKDNGDGTKTYRYLAYDVIDFAWVVYSDFEEYIDQWKDVSIRLLIPPEHSMVGPRFIKAVKQALEYLEEHVGPYPYPTITIVDPPLHSLGSGLMEYPMLITCGTFYHAPDNIRTFESLAIHEFTHQYFMATIASNEKEEAWLDEGFVTYFEDRIMDEYYGDNCSLYDILGYSSGNSENSRLEYTRLPNPSVGTIARPGWEIESAYKGLVYSKTSTMLRTLCGMVGQSTMDKIMQTYYKKWKFKHPKEQDFIDVVNEVIQKEHSSTYGENLNWFFEQCLHQTGVCDYAIGAINNDQWTRELGLFGDGDNKIYYEGKLMDKYSSSIRLERRGDLIFPVDIEVTFEDGHQITTTWSGEERVKILHYETPYKVISAHIDPERKIYLDLDFNNNSKTLIPNKKPCLKYTSKTVQWLQNILQLASFLF